MRRRGSPARQVVWPGLVPVTKVPPMGRRVAGRAKTPLLENRKPPFRFPRNPPCCTTERETENPPLHLLLHLQNQTRIDPVPSPRALLKMFQGWSLGCWKH